MALSVNTVTGNNLFGRLIKNLNKYLAYSNMSDEYIRYFGNLKEAISKALTLWVIATYFLPDIVRLNVLQQGTKSKYHAKFPLEKIGKMAHSHRGCQFIMLTKKVLVLRVYNLPMKNFFSGKTSSVDDVIKLLQQFYQLIDIISLLSGLVLESIIFADTSSRKQCLHPERVANSTNHLFYTLCSLKYINQ